MNCIIIEVRTEYSSYYIRALAIVRNGACYEIVFTHGTDVIYNRLFDEDEILVNVNKNGLLQVNIGLKELGSVSFYSLELWNKMKEDHDIHTYNEETKAFEEVSDEALHGEDTDDAKQEDFEDALLHDQDERERI